MVAKLWILSEKFCFKFIPDPGYPEPDSFSGSGNKFRIRPDPDPQHCCTGLHLAGDEQTRVSSDTTTTHRLNTGTELEIQSLLGIHVHSCTRWLSPRNPPPPLSLHLGAIRGCYWSAKIDDISLWPPATTEIAKDWEIKLPVFLLAITSESNKKTDPRCSDYL